MGIDQVRALDRALQASSEAISANRIVTALGGSKRDALRLLRQYRAEAPPTPPPGLPAAALDPAMVPKDAAPVPVASEAGPPTRLEEADAALQTALMAERRAQRALDFARSPEERQPLQHALTAARKEREAAATLLAQRQRSTAVLTQAIGPARIAHRRAQGALASLEDEMRRGLIEARRQAQQTRDELGQMIYDLTALAGAAAVPPEEGA